MDIPTLHGGAQIEPIKWLVGRVFFRYRHVSDRHFFSLAQGRSQWRAVASLRRHGRKCYAYLNDWLLSAGIPPSCTQNRKLTRSSADAHNRLDAFSGQSRSTNVVPFHMLHIVSYCAIVTLPLHTHTTSYWCSIVTMALSRVVSEIFNVE